MQADEPDTQGEKPAGPKDKPTTTNVPDSPGPDDDKKKKRATSKGKKDGDEFEKEFMGNVNKCVSIVEAAVKGKQSAPPQTNVNSEWANHLATKLDRLTELEAEEMRYEIDGIMFRAYMEKRQKEKKNE